MTQGTFNFTWDKTTRRERLATMRRIVEENAGLTTRMIANRMGLKKTPYIRQMLIELMDHGAIHYDWQEMTNGARVMVWFAGPTPFFETSETIDERERDLEPLDESGFPYVVIDERDPFWTGGSDGNAPTGE